MSFATLLENALVQAMHLIGEQVDFVLLIK